MRPSTSTYRRSCNHKHSSSRGIWPSQTSAKEEQDRKASNCHWWNWSCLGGQYPLQMYIDMSPGGLQLLCLWSETAVMHLHAPPSEWWCARHFLQRIDDTLQYLHCCLEEKCLDQFLIGSEIDRDHLVPGFLSVQTTQPLPMPDAGTGQPCLGAAWAGWAARSAHETAHL